MEAEPCQEGALQARRLGSPEEDMRDAHVRPREGSTMFAWSLGPRFLIDSTCPRTCVTHGVLLVVE